MQKKLKILIGKQVKPIQMKISVLTILLVILVSAFQAQDRITKASIIGKWQISTIAVPNLKYYDVAKDSFDIVNPIHRLKELEGDDSSIIDSIQREMYNESKKNMTKDFIKNGKPMFFIYTADGLVSFGFSIKDVESYTYSLDEKNAILTWKKKMSTNGVTKDIEEKYNVYMKNNILFLETGVMPAKLIFGFQKIE